MEDYFFDINDDVNEDKCFVLIIYDITDNKKRLKLAKFLQGYGFRVQKSAFEAMIKKDRYNKLVDEIRKYASGDDSIRIYKIIGKGQVLNIGKELSEKNEDVIII